MTIPEADLHFARRATTRFRQFRVTMISVTSALLVVAGIGVYIHAHATQSAKSTPPFHWATVVSPHPGTGDDELSSAATVNAKDAWAVGFYHAQTDSLYYQTLAEHWNGSAWAVIPSPSPGTGDNFLSSVAAVNATDAWAVGEYQNGTAGNDQTLTEHWNGSAWSVVPSPNPGGEVKFLFGVTALDATHAWAAGFDLDATSGALQTLIEQWDGSAWSVVPSPDPGTGNNELYNITAVDANNIWAVGDDQNGPKGIAQTLIEHWNGSAWAVVPSPNPVVGNNVLAGISAIDANNIWAVGYAQKSSAQSSQTLIEHWNGSSWLVIPSPNPNSGDNELFSVSALNANTIWAAGNRRNGASGSLHTLTEHWNGTSWSVESTPNPGYGDNSLVGIAAIDATHAWAVGEYHNDTPSQLLILHGGA